MDECWGKQLWENRSTRLERNNSGLRELEVDCDSDENTWKILNAKKKE